jgi:hypothetical protein
VSFVRLILKRLNMKIWNIYNYLLGVINLFTANKMGDSILDIKELRTNSLFDGLFNPFGKLNAKGW